MNRIMLLIIVIGFCRISFGSVILDIGSGIFVEAEDSVSVQVDSLVETGSGYFKGTITSGVQTGLTEFAGMSLSAGLTGSITRHTGDAYAKGNGEGPNFLRYYEVNNSGGSHLSADMQINFISSENDERNGLTAPYFIYRYAAAQWLGHGFGISASPDTATGIVIPAGESDWVLSTGCRLTAKLFLEGSFEASSDLMSANLLDAGHIPLTSPYTADSRSVSSIPANITDWILLQVRTAADGEAVSSRSAFLHQNGQVVGDDGVTGYTFISAFPGDYHLVLKHRNHLGVMSTNILTLSFE